nr:Protein of unknown function SprT domain containing protein [Haemonchus contortus]
MEHRAPAAHSSDSQLGRAQRYRRIVVLDDSSASGHSESQTQEGHSSSSLTSGIERETSLVDEGSDCESETEEEGCATESFIVSDNEYLTDDASFLSRSESDFSYGEEVLPTTTRKVLPQRCAKIVSSGKTPSQRKEIAKAPYACNDDFYNEGCHSDLVEHSVLSGSDDAAFSPAVKQGKESREGKSGGAVIYSDSDESSADDNFENYLTKLRQNRSTTKEEGGRKGHDDSSFVVSDDYVSGSTSSEDEVTDDSWTPSEQDEEDHRTRKQNLVNSIKDSFSSPSVLLKSRNKVADPEEHFLMSLSSDYSEKRHPEAEIFVKRGIKNEKLRMELTSRLFDIFRKECFKNEIPEFLPVKWNNRLYKTAGMCRNMSDRTSWIELSPKVCSTPDRVRDTLIHELCHAAVWVVDGKRKEGHGPLWKKWAAQCMQRFPFLPVIGRCHDYEIDAKFIYECGGCGQKVRRHTKSLDIDQKICGICKCRFTLQVRTRKKKDAAGNETSELNPFAKFVKENYGKHKGPGVKHGEVMRILAQLYKEKSASKDDIGDTNEQVSHDMSITESTEPLDMSMLSIHD